MSVIESPTETVAQPVTRADVLHRAADLLEEFGHCKNALTERDASGNVIAMCAVEAIYRADADLHGHRHYLSAAGVDAHEAVSLTLTEGLVYWNNRPERTKAEVVARLRAAANASPL